MANVDVFHEYVDVFGGNLANEMDERSADKSLFTFNFKERKGSRYRRR